MFTSGEFPPTPGASGLATRGGCAGAKKCRQEKFGIPNGRPVQPLIPCFDYTAITGLSLRVRRAFSGASPGGGSNSHKGRGG